MTGFQSEEEAGMKQGDNTKPNSQHPVIEELTVNQDQAAEVNGGSYRTISGRITAVPVDISDPIR